MSADQPVPLGGTKPRATLGYLLLQANQVVPTSQLLTALWSADNAPVTARKILQNAVWGLRGMLNQCAPGDGAPAELVTRAPGYMIRVDPDHVDLHLFRQRVRQGRARLAAGAPHEAANLFCEALELWRGPVLSDLVETGTMWPELTAVQNTRLDVLEDYFEAKLRCGQHYAVLGELETTVEAEPLRERSSGQLMLALYRCGRQADALSVYNRIRATLVEDLGLEPGHELRRLQQAILAHDPALNLAPAAVILGGPAPVGVPGGQVRRREDAAAARGATHAPTPLPEHPAATPAGADAGCPLDRALDHAADLYGAERPAQHPVERYEDPREERPEERRRMLAAVPTHPRGLLPADRPVQPRGAPVRRQPVAARPVVTERQRISVLLVQTRITPDLAGAAPDFLDEMFESVNAVARRRIERFGGDAVTSIGAVSLGLFRAGGEEGTAVRAVRAAAAIRDRLTDPTTDTGLTPTPWQGLTLHAAVATGNALVRFRPDDPTAAPSVNGALLDTCQCLLELAPAGEIQLCDATREALGPALRLDPLAGSSLAGVWAV
ncbi:AfsR/SARP family transcriptional regulator [Streptomyces sp. RerS4]|uniref:AfsR/SARP family transcriptional regulator n=1 Tax=Streptomyces sp. RerS4 TaxID=2942449 RepID=UPI00201BDC04|nr:AfsR/SARP family transcriptional regulator [Streptomyces sp. RerS4]UQX05333.1 AfsR/SARP family transcriptional regulator [Streptomyces sp. RerS4]